MIEFVLSAGGADLGRLPAAAGGVTVESVAFWIDRVSLSGDRGEDHDGDSIDGTLLDLTGGPVSFDLPSASKDFPPAGQKLTEEEILDIRRKYDSVQKEIENLQPLLQAMARQGTLLRESAADVSPR